MTPPRIVRLAAVLAALLVVAMAPDCHGAPVISRLTPPSALFAAGTPAPIVARFLAGQRFDVQATVRPDTGATIDAVEFRIDGELFGTPVTLAPATVSGLPAGTTVATARAVSLDRDGVHELTATATQSDGKTVQATGNFEVVSFRRRGRRVRNVIVMIGDGMGIAHRTAARIMLTGVEQGKSRGFLAMDGFPFTGMVVTHSLNSIVTDSSPGAACYTTGNKSNNNQQGVFPDDTTAAFDNPRVELIGEYLARTQGKSLGIVTTADVFDATPGAFGTHTANRGAGTGIVDQYLDEAVTTSGLRVLMGGGRKWFLPAGTLGSQRGDGTDYVLPDELAAGWSVAKGALDAGRDLIADFETAGFTYTASASELAAIPAATDKLLGLYAFSNMNVAKDKIDGRRGNPAVVNDYLFPDQPMLDEMTRKALTVLDRDPDGFVLMVEGASIDKQAHNMDSERWILDTIEFDRAIGVARDFAQADGNTLVIVTADHECAGINIIGASRVSDAELATRAASGGGADQLRTGVVGTYDAAGFPRYTIAPDGYPVTTDIDGRMLIGYAANADRYEDWRTNPQPVRDPQQPLNNDPPLSTYPNGPLVRDVAGNFLVTGQVADATAVHTASDIPLSAYGRGAWYFPGVMDNTDVFFRIMHVVVGGPERIGSVWRP